MNTTSSLESFQISPRHLSFHLTWPDIHSINTIHEALFPFPYQIRGNAHSLGHVALGRTSAFQPSTSSLFRVSPFHFTHWTLPIFMADIYPIRVNRFSTARIFNMGPVPYKTIALCSPSQTEQRDFPLVGMALRSSHPAILDSSLDAISMVFKMADSYLFPFVGILYFFHKCSHVFTNRSVPIPSTSIFFSSAVYIQRSILVVLRIS